LDWQRIVRAVEADEAERRAQWERWADEAIEPFLVVRHTDHAWGHLWRTIPPQYLAVHSAERYASELARSLGKPVRLVLNRRLSIEYGRGGEEIKRAVVRYGPPQLLPRLGVGNKQIS